MRRVSSATIAIDRSARSRLRAAVISPEVADWRRDDEERAALDAARPRAAHGDDGVAEVFLEVRAQLLW